MMEHEVQQVQMQDKDGEGRGINCHVPGQERERVRDRAVKEADVPEGSDSGVEVNGGGMMGGTRGDVTPAASCDSSLLSCYSSEDLVSHTLQLPDDLSLSAGDGTSEGGSESSSIAGYHQRVMPSGARKKCPPVRTPSNSRPSPSPGASARSRTPLSVRERTPLSKTTPKSLHPSRAISSPTTPRTHRDSSESSTSRKTVRVPSVSKNPSNSSPTDDGRWPSTVKKLTQIRPDKKNNLMNSSATSIESKATALEKYATLPRRRRKSLENLALSEPLSSREPSLNRSASLRKKQNPMVLSTPSSTLQGTPKTMPPYPRKSRPAKTRIFHEVSIQTALTGVDLESGLAGTLLRDVHSRVETKTCGVQVERGLRHLELLETQLRETKAQLNRLIEEKQRTSEACEQLRITRDSETIRLKTLIAGKCEEDLVGQLEKQVISTSELVDRQQRDISQLHAICHSLQRELDKSHGAQRVMLKHQEEGEAEAAELQDFLQAEKSALSDTLRDLESELSATRQTVSAKESELQRQQEECSHLVRICEQRRQEQLSLEARLAGLELRNRESLLQQGAAVSGASVALARLGSRLDHLVDSLVTSYNISDADLEDVIFHNEAYSQSSGSSSGSGSGGASGGESSAEGSPEHQRLGPAASFMAAVLNAIRSATSSRLISTEPSSEAEPMLSAEPEPSAFAHRDVTTSSSPQDMNKRHSLVSVGSLEPSSPSRYSEAGELANSESLHNLSLAILRRQQLESELPTALPPVPAHSLIDQVIDVDNLVTRLLKVIRIIQQANDNSSIQERKKLSDSLTESEAQLVSGEQLISQLTTEIQHLKDQLNNSMHSQNERERLHEKESQLGKACLSKQLITDNWSQAMSEVHRQYQAIDSALEVLASVPSVVQQSPQLAQLQRDLEEANFRVVSGRPAPDHNANPVLNGTA